jgi:hypothetical protein
MTLPMGNPPLTLYLSKQGKQSPQNAPGKDYGGVAMGPGVI